MNRVGQILKGKKKDFVRDENYKEMITIGNNEQKEMAGDPFDIVLNEKYKDPLNPHHFNIYLENCINVLKL
jgi:hypothetical protein